MVSWIDGIVPTPGVHAWTISEEALQSIGVLIADFRGAVSSYPNNADDSWFYGPPVPGVFATTGVIGHNDVDFGNVVFRDHNAVALIDFDFAGPSDRVWEVAVAAYYLVPVGKADTARCPPHEVLRDRLRIFTQACRLEVHSNQMFWDALAAFRYWRYERARRSERLTADWLDRYQDDSQWLANFQRLKPGI
jgi:Ser/Thr protein kinase RdoA (MazF antagonist)